MKKALILFFIAVAGMVQSRAQTCSSCGSVGGANSQGDDVGPTIKLSLGTAQYTQSAGDLTFSSSQPNPRLFTPAVLQFTAPTRTDVTVITTNLVYTNTVPDTNISANAIIVTNFNYVTNCYYDDTGTNLITDIWTNEMLDLETMLVTNTAAFTEIVTNAVIRQVNAPQMLADMPFPPTTNGYAIDFYHPINIVGTNLDGTYAVSGTPFVTWVVTNPAPDTINQILISKYGNDPNYGLMKQWLYTYAADTGTWSVQDLAGVQKNMVITNLNSTAYQIVNALQYSSGQVVQQTTTTYTNFDWGEAPIEVDVGSGNALQKTTYAYYDSGFMQSATHPDGSWEYYASYDTNGNPLVVYSPFNDVSLTNYSNGRQNVYTYNPTNAGVSASGDDGTVNPNVARRTVISIQGQEVSRSYEVFPSVYKRLDIQCTTPGAAWNASSNLVTTNLFYTSGPNQFMPQAVIRPDGTATVYNYITNQTCRTNITATGQPDSTCTYIVDGVSNVTVLNSAGYTVSVAAYDVLSGIPLQQDTYGNFDPVYGRPQQLTHLDGTTEYTPYACCGLDSTTDRDGLTTTYLYDDSQRQIGYEAFYQGTSQNPITYQNVLDAVGRTVQSQRTGSDNKTIVLSGTDYDPAGELITQTNALGGVTTYSRANDPNTGGLIRTTVYPNGATVTNFYYADGSLKSAAGTATHGKAYGYGTGTDVNGNTCTYTVETNLNSDGSLSSEWTKTFTDMAGRTTEILYADGHYSQSFYNSQGQLWKQVDPDGVATLYQYNAKGEQTCTAVAMNPLETSINFNSDRITATTNVVTTGHGKNVRRTSTYIWTDRYNISSTLVSTVETSTDGLNTWQTQYRDTSTAVVASSQTAPGSSRVVTTTAPDNSYTISTYSYGRLISSTRYDSTGAQIGGTSYAYDSQGRQSTVTDARNGTTTYGYTNADLVTSVTTPNPGILGGSPQTTKTSYNNMLQSTGVVQPDGTTVNTVYLLTGELGLQYGSRTYPVAYIYDYAGRMKTMTNWSNYSGGTGARVTTWNYDAYRGFLASKTYDGSTTGPGYTYTGAGRLASRVWARGITTSYTYDNAGSLINVSYSDSTPGLTNSYDRLGRLSAVACNGMTDTFTYNLASELLSESYSGGVLNGLFVTNVYDAFMRRTNLAILNSPSSILASTAYGYDYASRLSSVSDGNGNSVTNSYLANSPLVSQITFKQSGTTRMMTSKSYDYLNRLTSISSQPNALGLAPVAFNYNYNSANQRTRNALADGSYWIYQYDSLGQVTSGCKYWSDGTPVAGQQFDYTFDDIGNRKQTLSGGDQGGAGLRPASYSVNSLNQITSRDVPAYVDIKGVSFATNTVTVNGQIAYRKVEYFRDELPVNNSSSALWTNIIVAAAGQTSVIGNVYVAQQPETFKYDSDGNLTNDGRFNYTWDGENRLIHLISLTSAPVGSKVKLDFAYDYQGRRIQKIFSKNNGSIYMLQYTNRFVYDGWNLLAILNPQSSILASFTWGNDLSGSQQGAGGVGGLLAVSYYGSATTNCFPAFDGNGNVEALVNAADGTATANYEYGPFGEVIRSTGPMAKNNPFRFSTKYQDDESDLLYYGHRYYKPSTGTWPSRDPIEEQGGINLYGFVGNDGINNNDSFGLKIFVVRRPLTFFTKTWTDYLTGIGGTVGTLGGLPGVAFGSYLGKIAHYYRDHTWHCVLVIAPSCDPSLDKNGNLVGFAGVAPSDTWDFQSDDSINNPARDWQGSFKSQYYQGRKSVTTIVNDDSKDGTMKSILASEPQTQKYILGGSKRYNCCDWVTKVLSKNGLQFNGDNPKPFGDSNVPWWVPDGAIGKLIDAKN